MIKRLKYHEIDWRKYQKCLENSEQKNFFAQKEILDLLTEKWELLVFSDYRAIMPIPLKKKWGFNVVIMPLFLQQIGVFSEKDNAETNEKFLNYLKKNYLIFTYAFNIKNNFISNILKKKNYIIPKTNYDTLRKKYFKGRKSTVKSAQNLDFKKLELDEKITQFIRTHFKGLEKRKDLEKLIFYIQFLEEKNKLILYGSFLESKLTNLSILIKENDDFFLLGLISDANFKKNNGASFLIDSVLKNNINTYSLNFLGGNIRGIEIFFKSFNAEIQEYPFLQNSKIQLLRSFFVKQ